MSSIGGALKKAKKSVKKKTPLKRMELGGISVKPKKKTATKSTKQKTNPRKVAAGHSPMEKKKTNAKGKSIEGGFFERTTTSVEFGEITAKKAAATRKANASQQMGPSRLKTKKVGAKRKTPTKKKTTKPHPRKLPVPMPPLLKTKSKAKKTTKKTTKKKK